VLFAQTAYASSGLNRIAPPLATYNRCAIEEYQTDHGPADYALCAEGKILGIVSDQQVHARPFAFASTQASLKRTHESNIWPFGVEPHLASE
jgi:hypothetical protein